MNAYMVRKNILGGHGAPVPTEFRSEVDSSGKLAPYPRIVENWATHRSRAREGGRIIQAVAFFAESSSPMGGIGFPVLLVRNWRQFSAPCYCLGALRAGIIARITNEPAPCTHARRGARYSGPLLPGSGRLCRHLAFPISPNPNLLGD